MSPSPDRFSPSSKPPLPAEIPPMTEQPSAASDATPADASPAKAAALERFSDSTAEGTASAEAAPLVPKRPLMRPVSRPQPPTPPPATPSVASEPVEVVSPPPKPEALASQAVESTPSAIADAASGQELIRQQPIPPPSEPKQYRAIGLVRGRYTPSEEQFTRGAMITSDGTQVEAVLLGRVMSLVRNHLDLEQEHLWVVYPRTREMRQDLHVQIVGVWEPEKLNKDAEDDTESDAKSDLESEAELSAESETPVQVASSSPTPNRPAEDSGFDENYFSIRGEVVFYSAEDAQIAVKIQQAPRKTADREKAFKLQLDGTLSSPKALGYFWDLQVERRGAALVVTSGTPIGLVPPKKKTASAGLKRGGDRRPPQRKARPTSAARTAVPTGAPRREPLPKPVKRTEQASDS